MEKQSLSFLIAGGAGFIGSVVSSYLIEKGHRVTVLDNLSKGHASAIHPEARFIKGDIAEEKSVAECCSSDIDIAMHFAAFIEVGESVNEPARYYDNNVSKTLRFADNLCRNGVKKLVFSSTAAVYGEPQKVPLTEDAALLPVNPYGRTKLMVEQALADFRHAYDLQFVALRYFNAGGASKRYGEDHSPESHLIPRIINAMLAGDTIKVFGTDYKTNDGSCVRDYIHVLDLAEAHLLAAQYLISGHSSDCFNLGTGNGFSVLEVISAVERISGKPVSRANVDRRPGDSAILVASPEKARRVLGWGKTLRSLDEIIESAYTWKMNHIHGYGD